MSLKLEKDTYPAIEILLVVGCLPAAQHRFKLFVGFFLRDLRSRAISLNATHRAHCVNDLRLDPFARFPRISDPSRGNVCSELEESAHCRTRTRRKELGFSWHCSSPPSTFLTSSGQLHGTTSMPYGLSRAQAPQQPRREQPKRSPKPNKFRAP